MVTALRSGPAQILPQNLPPQGSGFDRQLVPATVDPEFDKFLFHECVQR
jgi:hypothetical protein